MTTSYSPLLRLALQGDGDNPNTWGQIANGSVFTLIETAISGYLQIDVTANLNITLTTVNGATDQARNAMIELNGALLLNDIDLIIPTVTKSYIVFANWTGTYNIRMKTSATGATVLLKPGFKYQVFCDGTNVYVVGFDVSTLGALAFLDTINDPNLLGNGVVTASAIATGAVTASAIAPGVITASALADGSITLAKIVDLAPNTILGNGAVVSGPPIATSVGNGLVLTSLALVVDAGTTANKIVQLDGSGKLPAIDGSQLTNINSGYTLLAVRNYSGGTNVQFTSLITSTYDEYVFEFVDIQGNNFSIVAEISTNNGSSFDTVTGNYNGFANAMISPNAPITSNLASTILPSNGATTFAGGSFKIFNSLSAQAVKLFGYDMLASFGSTIAKYIGGYAYTTASAINAIRFRSSSAIGGTVRMYGLKKTP